MATRQPRQNERGDTDLKEKPAQTKPPAMWQVVMYNDDYTPMEFVVDVLGQFLATTSNARRRSCSKYIRKDVGFAAFFRAMSHR